MNTLKKLCATFRNWVKDRPRRQPARQARLALETLEGRDLMSANPIALGDWVNLGLPGGTSYSTTTARDRNGNLDVFAVGSDLAVHYQSQSPSGAWSGWTSLGGAVYPGSLSAIRDNNGNMDIFAIGMSLDVCYRTQTPFGWTDWTSLGGNVLSITTALDVSGTVDVFGIGTNHSVYYQSQSPVASWSGWINLGGWVSSISAVRDNFGHVGVFAIGGEHAVWYQMENLYGWSGWNPLGGWVSSISTALDANGNWDVFGISGDKAVYYRDHSGFNSTWTDWISLGGQATSISAICDSSGTTGVFAIGADDNQDVWYQVQSPYGWSGWMPLYGNGVTSISAACDTGGNLGVFDTAGQQVSCRERAAYVPVYGSLFGPGGPSYKDVQQGAIGDCWLLAGLAEVAARAPSDITSMFSYAGASLVNGCLVYNYTVRLYDTSGVARYFTVDTELPAGGFLYDQPVGGVLWVALAEKAYAEANGYGYVISGHRGFNYYDALNGGGGASALQAITGNSASGNPFGSATDITTAWQNGQLITLATPSSKTPLSVNGLNVAENHVYAVVGYYAPLQLFTLFNPWGVNGNYDQTTTTKVFCPGTVTETAQQLAAAFTKDAIGSGAAPGGPLNRDAQSSQGLPDLAFLADLPDHSMGRRTIRAGLHSAMSAS
jgi:hypothetical protein